MSKSKAPAADPTANSIQPIALDKLHLDADNPRLPESLKRSEPEMLLHIAETTAIEDLVNAIAENGYFEGEPLVVVEIVSKPGHFTVVEGNRRLTALRLLQNPRTLKEPSKRLLAIVAEAQHKPDLIPCVVCASRTDVLPYLGFRHITGVKEWEPLAKARYMKQLLDALTDKKTPADERYATIARAIGSRRDHIQRNLDALAVYVCARDAQFFGIANLGEDTLKFGTLYTAIGDDRIGAYVGSSRVATPKKSDGDKPRYEAADPIIEPDVLNRAHIEELLRWMFEENKDGETRLGDSRNLKKLGVVLTHGEAVRAMRAGSALDYAYRLTSGVTEDFMSALYLAEEQLREAASLVATVTSAPGAGPLVEQIGSQVDLLRMQLQRKKLV